MSQRIMRFKTAWAAVAVHKAHGLQGVALGQQQHLEQLAHLVLHQQLGRQGALLQRRLLHGLRQAAVDEEMRLLV